MSDSTADVERILESLKREPYSEANWTALHARLWPFVVAVAYRRLGGRRELAEDAAQEVFLRLVRTQPFGRIPDGHALRGFVWRIADNVARSYRRALETVAGATSDPVLEDVPASEVGQDRVLEARERLASTLAGFSPLDRQIVVMAATGHSLKEIGEATGLSYSNTAVRLHRLRNRLHDKDLEAPKEKL